ncbi:unnamed protein product [Eruca vesicaria subsp. sativa]|uniref:Uncharacterized protein n=1 Tax=Eruca vesicaria subsp. sativa TaxID=29727 RepID=A0ABC8J3I4_ERUVS|nr:unnamed protein product [Eruca vesicaria subsp. sativa]
MKFGQCSFDFSWKVLIKDGTAHPSKKTTRDEIFEDYEDLQLIFEQGLATGKNAIGLGDDTDAETFRAKDNGPFELNTRSFGYTGNEGSQASRFSDSTLPRSTKGPSEKLPRKKKAKSVEGGESSNSNVDGIHMEKSFNEMIRLAIRLLV